MLEKLEAIEKSIEDLKKSIHLSNKELWTDKDLQAYAEVGRHVTWKWRNEGLPYRKVDGNGKIMYEKDICLRWIKSKFCEERG